MAMVKSTVMRAAQFAEMKSETSSCRTEFLRKKFDAALDGPRP